MPAITILLAVHNGEKYINQQIESIVKQTFYDWQLVIHDDRSEDKTCAIIREWQKMDNRIKFIEDDVHFFSAPANFMHLLKFATGDFVMFCDQDDVWLENKLQAMYDVIIKKDNSRLQVVYSNAKIWDGDQIFGGTIPFWKPQHLKDAIFLNGGIHGCVSLFNYKVLSLMLEQKKTPAMHDHLLLLIGLSFGEVTYMDDELVLFRRHQNAITNGMEVRKSRLKSLLNREKFPVIDFKHYYGVYNFFYDNCHLFNAADKKMFECYISLPNKFFFIRFIKILQYKFTHGGSWKELWAKLLTRKYFC